MAEKFEQWCICELMGRQQVAGRASEEVIGGAALLRVDVPDGDSFRTAYYGSSAIYALHVVDEKVARAMASQLGRRPPYAWTVGEGLKQLAGPAAPPTDVDGPEDEEEERDIEF